MMNDSEPRCTNRAVDQHGQTIYFLLRRDCGSRSAAAQGCA